MTIGSEIITAFAVPVACTAIVGGLSIALMREMNNTGQRMAAGSHPGINAVGRLAGGRQRHPWRDSGPHYSGERGCAQQGGNGRTLSNAWAAAPLARGR